MIICLIIHRLQVIQVLDTQSTVFKMNFASENINSKTYEHQLSTKILEKQMSHLCPDPF